jgi:hypothetical protein
MTDSQADSTAMLTAVDAANRALLAAWGAKPPHGAKKWQFQAGLYVIPGYSSPSGEWGSWAYVRSYSPSAGECTVAKAWAPTWLEAIEVALEAALSL